MQKVKLVDICYPKQWKTIPASQLKSEGYPVYGANGVIGYYSDYNHVKPTILITCRGATCGSINVCKEFSYVNGNAMSLDNLSENVDLTFLKYQLENFDFSPVISGSAQPQITREGLQKVVLKLFDLQEQKAIAEKLDKVSILIEKRKQQLSLLDTLVKSKFVEMFGDSEFNTKGFPIFKLDSLCNVRSSKRIYQHELVAEGIPFLRIADLNDRIDKRENLINLYIPESTYMSLKDTGLVPKAGDLLVTSRGTLGRCYMVGELDEFYFQDGMITWLSDISEKVTSMYLSYLFDSKGIKKQIIQFQAGSTVAYLSIAMAKKLNIMLPPIILQNRFTIYVNNVEKTKAKIKQSLAALELLKKSLMQKYFG